MKHRYSLVTEAHYKHENTGLFASSASQSLPPLKFFPYRLRMADLPKPSKDAPIVFSCFSGGGGSSLGYKLAGFRSAGGCDLDRQQSAQYRENLKPPFFYEGFVKDLVASLPRGFPTLDILDGSPPCSTFSTAGQRDKAWGKEKHFREGQAAQVLDELFWDFLDIAKALRPKVVIGENVDGMTKGKATKYLQAIQDDYASIGYLGKWYRVKSEDFGLPQRRHRVFFIALRSDLVAKLAKKNPYYKEHKRLWLRAQQPHVPAKVILSSKMSKQDRLLTPFMKGMADKMRAQGLYGKGFELVHERGSCFNFKLASLNRPLNTITAVGRQVHPTLDRFLSAREIMLASSWPLDYQFAKKSPSAVAYVCGMSVPPALTATIASAVRDQWLVHL